MKRIGSLFYKPKRRDAEIKSKRWSVWGILGKAIRKTCTAIGAAVLISVIISVLLVSSFAGKSAPALPDDIVLYFDMSDGITETQVKPTLLEPFPFMQPTLRNIIDTLEKAKDDERVRGFIVKLNGASMNVAHIQELRAAVKDFKSTGKFAKIYSPSYTDTMGGLSQYYFASAFDEVWMQPVGMLSISGTSMEMPFAKAAMEKLGVSADFFQREEFKSAMENFTNSEISPANSAALQSLLNGLSIMMVNEAAKDRGLSPVFLRSQVDKGIMTGNEALSAKLIDRLDYGDTMLSEIRKEATGDADDESVELVNLARYSQDKSLKKVNPAKKAKTSNVALIYVVGTIVDSAGAGGNAGADELTNTITIAANDDDIKAIVLRVDSPGGSPTASETIRRALVRAQEKGKKVVVSMGPVAASGGYWISADADKIVASSGTITGSIGVVMGKFEAGELFSKMGVNWQGPGFGENSDIWALHKPFDESARARMNVLIDDVYEAFISRVVKGRELTAEQAKAVAKGRAWTGEQALKRGLVDELGGLNEALDITAQLIGKEKRSDLNIIKMPRELNGVERVLELMGQEVSLGHFMKTALGIDIKTLQSYMTQKKLLETGTRTSVYSTELDSLR